MPNKKTDVLYPKMQTYSNIRKQLEHLKVKSKCKPIICSMYYDHKVSLVTFLSAITIQYLYIALHSSIAMVTSTGHLKYWTLIKLNLGLYFSTHMHTVVIKKNCKKKDQPVKMYIKQYNQTNGME